MLQPNASEPQRVVRRTMFRVRAMSQLLVRKTLVVRRTMFPALPQTTPRNLNRTSRLLRPARGILSGTRNTSNSNRIWPRSRINNTNNSSKSRSRNTSGWRNRRRVTPEPNRSNKGTSNRPSNWSKNTLSSNNTCRRSSNRLDRRKSRIGTAVPHPYSYPLRIRVGRTFDSTQSQHPRTDQTLVRCEQGMTFDWPPHLIPGVKQSRLDNSRYNV